MKQANEKVQISPEDVRGEINGVHAKQKDLAERFDVHPRTIRNKIRILRQDDDPIIHTPEGYILITKEWCEDENNAKELEQYVSWVIRTLKSLRPLIKGTKPMLPQMKRTLSLNYSKEEKHEVMKICASAVALLAWAEIEEDE